MATVMSEQFEQDDREALAEILVQRLTFGTGEDAEWNDAIAAGQAQDAIEAGFRRSPAPQQVSTVEGLDEMERLAQRLRDRGFPKLAPVVRSDLVLRAADALEALIERVQAAEAKAQIDDQWEYGYPKGVAPTLTFPTQKAAERSTGVFVRGGAIRRRRKAGPWEPVPEGSESDG